MKPGSPPGADGGGPPPDDERAWRPLGSGRAGAGAEAFVVTPFTRLARAHALGVAGDTLVALALAGSLFFSIDPQAARWRIALYLLLTMAPFAVVAPLIGPAIDRAKGGRKGMVVGSMVGRALLAALMIGHTDSLWLFPEAFLLLVLSKGYHVAKSALVPTFVEADALVQANSRLAVVSGIVGAVAALPGLLVLRLGGPPWVLGVTAVVFGVGALVSLRVPSMPVAPTPAGPAEEEELRGAGILLAASAMGLLRAIVGFLTFLIAFSFRMVDAPTWWFGAAVAVSALGSLAGAVVAPLVRRAAHEELMLIGVLGMTAVIGLFSAASGQADAVWQLVPALVMGTTVGLASGAGKQAFDAIVQRDAPDANRGRSFARFETRFQIAWVLGGFLPVVVPVPAGPGYLAIAVVAGFACFSYLGGVRLVRRTPPGEVGRVLEQRSVRHTVRQAQHTVREWNRGRRGRGRPDGGGGEPGAAGVATPPEATDDGLLPEVGARPGPMAGAAAPDGAGEEPGDPARPEDPIVGPI